MQQNDSRVQDSVLVGLEEKGKKEIVGDLINILKQSRSKQIP